MRAVDLLFKEAHGRRLGPPLRRVGLRGRVGWVEGFAASVVREESVVWTRDLVEGVGARLFARLRGRSESFSAAIPRR